MNDNDTASLPEALDEEALRRRLINRIALAAIAIVVLLGGLAVIDSLYVAPSSSLSSSISKTNPSSFTTDMSKPVDGVALSSAAMFPEVSATTAIAPAVPPPAPPAPEASPTIKIHSEPEESSSPSTPLPKQVSPIIPNFAKTPQSQAALPATPAEPATGKQYVVQMGVFNNFGNAQELLGKLQKIGVPAQIESRVQVGPFKTKAEADTARTKLQAMGLAPGLLVTTHK